MPSFIDPVFTYPAPQYIPHPTDKLKPGSFTADATDLLNSCTVAMNPRLICSTPGQGFDVLLGGHGNVISADRVSPLFDSEASPSAIHAYWRMYYHRDEDFRTYFEEAFLNTSVTISDQGTYLTALPLVDSTVCVHIPPQFAPTPAVCKALRYLTSKGIPASFMNSGPDDTKLIRHYNAQFTLFRLTY